MAEVVVDASAMIDLLLGIEVGVAVVVSRGTRYTHPHTLRPRSSLLWGDCTVPAISRPKTSSPGSVIL